MTWLQRILPQSVGVLGFPLMTSHNHRTEERSGMFIPNWAVSTVFAAFLFLAGSAVTYFHQQATVDQNMALLQMRMTNVEKTLESMASKSLARNGVAVDELAKVQVQLESISERLDQMGKR